MALRNIIVISLFVTLVVVSCQLVSGGSDLHVGSGAGGVGDGGGPGGGGGVMAMGGSGGSGGSGGGGATGPHCNDGIEGLVGVFGDDQLQTVHDVTPTPDGGCILVGSFVLSFEDFIRVPPTTFEQPFVVKLDSLGGVAWAKVLQGLEDDSYRVARHVAIGDTGKVFVAGIGIGPTAPAVFVAKLDEQGVVLWRKEMIASAVDIRDFVVGDKVWVGGVHTGTLDLYVNNTLSGSTTGGSAFVLGLSRDLQEMSTDQLTLAAQRPVSVDALALGSGLLVIAGTRSGGEILTFSGNGVEKQVVSEGTDGLDAFVLAYDLSSGFVFASDLVGSGDILPQAAAISDDEIAVAGNFSRQLDPGGLMAVEDELNGFLFRIDHEGTSSSVKTMLIGSTAATRPVVFVGDLHLHETGDVLVAGTFNGGALLPGLQPDEGRWPFVLRLDEANLTWTEVMHLEGIGGDAMGVHFESGWIHLAATMFEAKFVLDGVEHDLSPMGDVVLVGQRMDP